MIRKLILSYFLIASLLSCANIAKAAVEFTSDTKIYTSVFEVAAEDLINLSKEDLQIKIGRELNLKEKISLGFVKHKLRKNRNLTGESALEQVKTDGMAIAGFVTGLVSVFLFGIILGILGVIFSAIALKRINKEPETRKGKGFAVAGLVLGIVGILGALVVLALLV